MTPRSLDPITLYRLERASTATIATLLHKRGLRSQYVQGVGRLGRDGKRMVGPAFTLRCIPARGDLDVVATLTEPNNAQQIAVDAIPYGHVLVMDSPRGATAASLGSILFARLEMKGCAGVVTDAPMSDADVIGATETPCYCAGPSPPTNPMKLHAVDTGLPIGCGGAPVYPGDIMVGDTGGVIVIPAELADDIAEEAAVTRAFEDFILLEIRSGRPIRGTYPPDEATLARFAAFKSGTYDPRDTEQDALITSPSSRMRMRA